MKKTLALLSLIASYSTIYGANINLEKTEIYSETGYKMNLRNSISSPFIITSKEIEEKKFTSIAEILSSVSGVNVRDGILPQVDLRGQGFQKARATVQLLVDGVPANMLDTSHMNVPVNMVNPKDIERVEIIPGGGAVLYGSGTAGGVINIITKRGKGTHINAGYRIGSFSNHKYDISAGTSLGKFDFDLAYSKNKSDAYRKREKLDSDYISTRLSYNINDTDNITLKYSGYRNDYLSADLLSKTQIKNDRRQSGVSGIEKEKNKIKKDEFSFIYNNKLGEYNNLNIVAFHQNTELPSEKINDQGTGMYMGMLMGEKKGLEKALLSTPEPAKQRIQARLDKLNQDIAGARGNKFYFSQNSLFKDTKKGIKIKNKFNYAKESNLILGFGYTDNNMVRNTKMNILDKNHLLKKQLADINIVLDKKTYEIFGVNTYKYQNFEFTQGLRYEDSRYKGSRKSNDAFVKIDRKIDNVAGTLGLNYLYSETGNVYAKYERAFTSPAPAQLTDKVRKTPKAPLFDYVVNDLKTEKTNLFEIGWNDYLLNSLLGASIYLSETKNEIATVFDGGIHSPTNGFSNLNIGKTRRYGFDLKAEQKIDKIRLTESYSFIKTKIVSNKSEKLWEGNQLSEVPKHKITLSLDYDLTDKITLGADYKYKSTSFIDNTNKSGKNKAESTFDIRLNYRPVESLEVYAGVKNLFDSKYYIETKLEDNKEKRYNPAAGRNYYAGFNYKF